MNKRVWHISLREDWVFQDTETMLTRIWDTTWTRCSAFRTVTGVYVIGYGQSQFDAFVADSLSPETELIPRPTFSHAEEDFESWPVVSVNAVSIPGTLIRNMWTLGSFRRDTYGADILDAAKDIDQLVAMLRGNNIPEDDKWLFSEASIMIDFSPTHHCPACA